MGFVISCFIFKFCPQVSCFSNFLPLSVFPRLLLLICVLSVNHPINNMFLSPCLLLSLYSPILFCTCVPVPTWSTFPSCVSLRYFLVCTSLFWFSLCFAFVSWISPMLLSSFLLLHFGFFELAVQPLVIRSHFSLIVIIISSRESTGQKVTNMN